MKVVIIGAGNVGIAIAEAASQSNDVLVIEKDAVRAEKANSVLQVSVLLEDGSNPKVLADAIDRMGADIVFSAVPDDGINIFICSAAKAIKPGIISVACIRNTDYMMDDIPGVDSVISPESITAERIVSCAMLENAVSFERTGTAGLCLVTFKIEDGHQVVGRTVMDLELPPECTVVAIVREDETDLTVATAEVKAGDRLILLGTWDAAVAFNRLVGIKKEAREFVVLGAGPMARTVAKDIDECPGRQFVKLIDNDLALCKLAAHELRDVVVVNGNTVDPMFLRSESVNHADVLISLSDMDERNLLASMTALRFGNRKIITRYNTDEYEEIFKYAGIESTIGYHRVIINAVTEKLAEISDRKGEAVMILDNPSDHFFGIRVDGGSPLLDMFLGDVSLPEEVCIPAVLRDGEVIYTRLGTRFLGGDLALVYAHEAADYRLSAVFGKHTPEM